MADDNTSAVTRFLRNYAKQLRIRYDYDDLPDETASEYARDWGYVDAMHHVADDLESTAEDLERQINNLK